jgi:two-component system sensor histidine kinase TtrS
LINRSIDHPLDRFGGVIFTRKDNTDVNNLLDLKGRSLTVVDVTSFGGYLMALREFEEAGIDTSKELEVKFQGTYDAVVRAVLERRVVADTVRTDTLERMADAGLIELQQIKTSMPCPLMVSPIISAPDSIQSGPWRP